jgi:hypothetical protein
MLDYERIASPEIFLKKRSAERFHQHNGRATSIVTRAAIQYHHPPTLAVPQSPPWQYFHLIEDFDP